MSAIHICTVPIDDVHISQIEGGHNVQSLNWINVSGDVDMWRKYLHRRCST